MASNVNIFDKYGIKEVANVYFEALDSDEKAGVYKGDIVLFLDTLKVSTIETTAETADATGGWGNPKLVSWDYGKEITITLEDALMSLESLRFMLGGAIHRPAASKPTIVRHTEEVVCTSGGVVPYPVDHLTGRKFDGIEAPAVKATAGHPIRLINLTTGARTQLQASGAEEVVLSGSQKVQFKNPHMLGNETPYTEEGDHIRIFWEDVIESDSGSETAIEVTISPSTFPGTYKIVGDTFMRSEKTGKDEPFQFIIGKAKVSSEVTITLEAEGDPSTFEMTLNVLRSTNERGENEMMKLIRYDLGGSSSGTSGNDNGSLGG